MIIENYKSELTLDLKDRTRTRPLKDPNWKNRKFYTITEPHIPILIGAGPEISEANNQIYIKHLDTWSCKVEQPSVLVPFWIQEILKQFGHYSELSNVNIVIYGPFLYSFLFFFICKMGRIIIIPVVQGCYYNERWAFIMMLCTLSIKK